MEKGKRRDGHASFRVPDEKLARREACPTRTTPEEKASFSVPTSTAPTNAISITVPLFRASKVFPTFPTAVQVTVSILWYTSVYYYDCSRMFCQQQICLFDVANNQK